MTHELSAAAACGRTIVVPSAELAAALLEALERQLADTLDGVWPTPRIREFGSWLREQYERRQLLDASLPRLLGDAEERELWRSILSEDETTLQLLEPNGAARAARQARRTLVEYGITPGAVAGIATEETEAFMRWYASFEQRCRALDAIAADRALEYLLPSHEPLAWVEASAWRPVARSWLERHVGAPLQASNVQGASVRHVRAESATAELAAIAQWAAARLAGNPRFTAWICVPDLDRRRADVIEAFDAVLAPQRLSLNDDTTAPPYAIAGGTALAQFAPVRALLDVLSAASGEVTFDAFSALVRMPALQAEPDDESSASRVELELRRRGPAEAPLHQWLQLLDSVAQRLELPQVAAASRLRAMLELLAASGSADVMSRWIEVWIKAWHAGPWLAAQRWSSVEYQAAMRFRELLGSLAVADRIFGSVSRQAAQGILMRAAQETQFQPQTGIPAIWISSQLMDPWLSYDGLWVTRCSADAWPPAINPVPLLPLSLQRQAGIVSAAAATQLESARQLQSAWLARARECVFSCAESGEGTVSLSPILPPPTPAMAPLPAAQARPLWAALLAAAPPLERLIDVRGPVFGAAERTRGVSTLKAQSCCAFRGFAETRLRASRMDKPVPGFNELERGDLVHYALEIIWRTLRGWSALQALDAERQAELIDAAALEAIERLRKRRDPGGRWRSRERVRLGQLLCKWLDTERGRSAFEVEQIEDGAHHLQRGGLTFTVRIDRIDRLDDGSRVLIDYKTGLVQADWRGERPFNPQLPMYALCQPQDLIAVAYGQVNAGNCRFLAESERAKIFAVKGTGAQATKLENRHSFAELVQTWSDRIETLAQQVASGEAQVAPLPNACRQCHVHALCRVKPLLDDESDDD